MEEARFFSTKLHYEPLLPCLPHSYIATHASCDAYTASDLIDSISSPTYTQLIDTLVRQNTNSVSVKSFSEYDLRYSDRSGEVVPFP